MTSLPKGCVVMKSSWTLHFEVHCGERAISQPYFGYLKLARALECEGCDRKCTYCSKLETLRSVLMLECSGGYIYELWKLHIEGRM
jgi:hypothetical protein